MAELTRRQFLRNTGAATAPIALAAARVLCLPEAVSALDKQNRKPNIIFILADDLGYGDVGCYGQRRIRTPHIDRMAKEGVRFTDCYSGSTVCAPSRCSLMTGLHTGHCHVRGNMSNVTRDRVPLRPGDTTIAEMLKAAGYRTGIVGKWGLGEQTDLAERHPELVKRADEMMGQAHVPSTDWPDAIDNRRVGN
jgi:arylsulfatase A